jgi:subtilisin family serine protease
MKKVTILVPVIMILSLISAAQGVKKESLPSNSLSGGINQPMFHKGMITIKVKEGTGDLYPQRGSVTFGIPSLDSRATKYQVNRLEKRFIYNTGKLKRGMPDLSRIYRIEFPEEYSVLKVAEDFAVDPNIEYAEPVPVSYPLSVPNDTLYPQQDYLQQVFAENAWTIHKGENGPDDVVIAVVDCGIDWDHEDLVDNLWQNLGEDADADGKVLQQTFPSGEWIFDPDDENGVDDDGNGYIDDFIGWNFSLGSNDPHPIQGTSYWEHGTLMAGYAAASTNNVTGVASLSWNLKFMPVQAGWESYVPQFYDAAIYAAENGADVISCSWGNYWYNSQANQEAINYALALGSIIVGAAGNHNKFKLWYPSSYPGVVSVAAVNQNNQKAGYSNYGPHVKISAPGSGWTTSVDNTYSNATGTSCSAPIVGALMGLVKSYHPNWTSDQVITQVLGTADNIDSINPGYENLLGSGRINAFRALTETGVTLAQEIALDVCHVSFKDSDNDLSLQPGDTATLDLVMRNYNYGVGPDNATFTLISDHPSIVILNDSYSCSIPPDNYFTLDNAFPFIVGDADSTFLAEFRLITTSEKEITWGDTLSFSLLVAPQGLMVWQDPGLGHAYSGDFINEYLVSEGYNTFYTSQFPSSFAGFDAVFLSFGNFRSDLSQGTYPTMEMTRTITDYLEQGGSIFLDCGTFFGIQTYCNFPDVEYLKGLFGISETYFPMTNNPINLLTGCSGSICEGLEFTASDQNPVWYIEKMTPNEHGQAALEEEGYGTVAIHGNGEFGQETFYMSYALGKLVDNAQGTREELLSRIVGVLVGLDSDEPGIDKHEWTMNIYPNPACGIVDLRFTLPDCVMQAGIYDCRFFSLKVYDVFGKEVWTGLNEIKSPGEYSVKVDVSGLQTGMYVVRLQAGSEFITRKIVKL